MEKTIKIDGKQVKLKANAKLPLIYMGEFGEDIMQVQGKIFGIITLDGKIDMSRFPDINCLGVMHIIWSMAKCANPNVALFENWLDEFESFPILDVMLEVMDLFFANMSTGTRIKNVSAAEA